MNKESYGRKVLHALQKLHINEGDIIIVSDYEVAGVLCTQPMPGVPTVPIIYSEGGVASLEQVDIGVLRQALLAAEGLERERLKAAANSKLPPKLEVVQ